MRENRTSSDNSSLSGTHFPSRKATVNEGVVVLGKPQGQSVSLVREKFGSDNFRQQAALNETTSTETARRGFRPAPYRHRHARGFILIPKLNLEKNLLFVGNDLLATTVGSIVAQSAFTYASTATAFAVSKTLAGLNYNTIYSPQFILAGTALGFFVATSVLRKVFSGVNRMLLTSTLQQATVDDVKDWHYLKKTISERIEYDASMLGDPKFGEDLKKLLFDTHYKESFSDKVPTTTPPNIEKCIKSLKSKYGIRGRIRRIFSSDDNVSGNIKKPISERIKIYDEIMRHHFGILKMDEPKGQGILIDDLVKLEKTYGESEKVSDLFKAPAKGKEDDILNGFRAKFKIIGALRYACLAAVPTTAVLGIYNVIAQVAEFVKLPKIGVEFTTACGEFLSKIIPFF